MKLMTPKFPCVIILGLSLNLLTGCANSFHAGTDPADPAIVSFTPNPTAVVAGGAVSLTGVFTNGTGVITPGNLSVTSGTAVSVTPMQTTAYVLTVSNTSGSTVARTVTVNVTPTAPAITSFTATPPSITAGASTSLSGVFTNGTGVITPGNIAVTSGTPVTVTPSDTTIYTLTVTNAAGDTITQTATVTVNPVAPPAPAISSFKASTATISAAASISVAPNTTVMLNASFSGGTGVITPGDIPITSGNSVSITPPGTTVYTLTVTNPAGVFTTSAVTVAVTPNAPVISTFSAKPDSITPGGTAILASVFGGGSGVITPGNIAVTSGAQTSVMPTYTTVYTLTVTNSAGVTTSHTATVTVTPNTPVISEFIADPPSITPGGTSNLTGVFSDGTGMISPGNIPVTSGTPVSVTPAQTTIYTLIVTPSSGAPTTQTVTVTVSPTAASITSFNATPSSISAGDSSSLTGVFANGTGVITPGNISVTSGTPVSVTPSQTTTYTLTVTPPSGPATSQTTIVTVTASVPTVPTGLVATGGNQEVNLSWLSVTGATSYTVWRSTTSGGPYAQIGSTAATAYQDNSVVNNTTYYYVVEAVDSAGPSANSAQASATPTATSSTLPPPDDPTKSYVGLGTWFMNDWDGSSAFVDVFKQSRVWQDAAWKNNAIVDALGWPTEDASTVLMTGYTAGTYKLVFNGQATVQVMWVSGSVANQAYDAATNTTTADFILNETGTGSMGIIFTNTKRTASSATGTGFTNAQLYRPGYPTDGSVVFTAPFLAAMGKVSTVRMMDWTNTNGNYVVNWADRVTPLSATQGGLPNPPYTAPDSTVYNGLGGVALEYQILLCNTLQVDCYFNIPMVANDDYVHNMAMAIDYGTDGTNPYTSQQANPVFPPLNANLKFYLEYANEIWNTSADVFPTVQSIVSELPADHPLRTVDDTPDVGIYFTMWRYPAWRMATISQQFEAVFGSSQMMTRVRPLLETQAGDGQETMEQALQWLDAYAKTLTPATTVSGLLYGGGGSGYYGVINSTSAAPDSIFAVGNYPDPNFTKEWATDSVWDYNYGIKHVAYEGGPGINGGFSDGANRLINADPRMETMVDAYQIDWAQQGGDLLVYYTVEGPPAWEFTDDITNIDTPKFDALADIQSAPRVAVTLGAALPGTLSASAENTNNIRSLNNYGYTTTVGGESCNAGNGAGGFSAYPAHAATAFTGTLTLSGTASSSTSVDIMINGADQGTVTIPSGTGLENSSTLQVNIPAGLSVIRMTTVSGNMTFCGLTVTNP